MDPRQIICTDDEAKRLHHFLKKWLYEATLPVSTLCLLLRSPNYVSICKALGHGQCHSVIDFYDDQITANDLGFIAS